MTYNVLEIWIMARNFGHRIYLTFRRQVLTKVGQDRHSTIKE